MLLSKSMPKVYILEDTVKQEIYCFPKFTTKTIGRNTNCSISTLNPRTMQPGYTDEQKLAAGHVSGIHFHLSYEPDGNLYIWDNKSTNGLYVKLNKEDDFTRVTGKTRILPGSSIFASTVYEFILREETIDLHAQNRAEERAGSSETSILDGDEIHIQRN